MVRVYYSKCPIQQADAVLSQANPVSTTLYEVLATTKNVRIISISANITWATTQPTPLEVVVTIDGQSHIYLFANPVSATEYEGKIIPSAATNAQQLAPTATLAMAIYRAFFLEGKSVRIQIRITWATTQPTPLVCRVKWAKLP